MSAPAAGSSREATSVRAGRRLQLQQLNLRRSFLHYEASSSSRFRIDEFISRYA